MSVPNIELLDPDFVINCRNISHSSDVYSLMRGAGISRSFAYAMIYKPTLLSYLFIKIGMSSPSLNDREHQVGERIVRQLSWVPGWTGEPPKTSNGLDFWLNVERDLVGKQLPTTFNKNDIEVAVWDVSKRMACTDVLAEQENRATAWVEGSLAQQHKDLYKKLPPLNFADPSTTRAFKSPHISKSAFETNFEII